MSAAGTEQPKLAAIIPQRRIDVAAHHPLAQRKETPALDPLDEHRRLRRSRLSRFHSTGHRPCLWWLGLAFWIGIDPLLGAEKRPAASFEALTEFARTASLRAAAKAGDVTRVEVLLKEHPTWARSTDLDGNTLLHTAASTGNPTLAQLLLTYGIPINATNQTGHTALHIAAHGHKQAVELLLARGADAAATNGAGELALELASQANHVRQMGELVEARRVVWGSYRRIDGRWQVWARVLRVATGKRSRRYQASSTDWFTLRDNLVDRIVRELELRPSPEETRQMRARFTESAEALTWAGKALTAWEERQSFDQMEGHFRRALAADPQCHGLRRFLAASLGSQGKLDEAETAVLTVLQSKPDDAAAHKLLGIIHQLRNKRTAAFKELRLALRLDAEDTETWERMGELHAWSKHREAALHFWSTAARRSWSLIAGIGTSSGECSKPGASTRTKPPNTCGKD